MVPAPSRWQRSTTVAVGLLAVGSSLLGLLQPDHYPPALLPQFYVQDAVTLGIAVPTLAVGLRYAMQGSLRGRIVWLGALAYMTYIWTSVALQVPFTRFFLGYVLLTGLSLFTFVGGVAGLDPTPVRETLVGRIQPRLYAGFLAAIAGGLAVLWLSELVPATLSGTPPTLVEELGPQALVSHFIDLSVVVPALLVTAWWLLHDRPWGYVFTGVALVFGGLLAPALTGMTLLLYVGGDVTVPLVAVFLTIIPALVAAGLAVTYLRRLGGDERTAHSDRTWQLS